MHPRRRLAAVTVLALAAVLAAGLTACGSDNSQSDGAAQPTPSTTTPAQPTTTDAASTGQPAEAAQLENGTPPGRPRAGGGGRAHGHR